MNFKRLTGTILSFLVFCNSMCSAVVTNEEHIHQKNEDSVVSENDSNGLSLVEKICVGTGAVVTLSSGLLIGISKLNQYLSHRQETNASNNPTDANESPAVLPISNIHPHNPPSRPRSPIIPPSPVIPEQPEPLLDERCADTLRQLQSIWNAYLAVAERQVPRGLSEAREAADTWFLNPLLIYSENNQLNTRRLYADILENNFDLNSLLTGISFAKEYINHFKPIQPEMALSVFHGHGLRVNGFFMDCCKEAGWRSAELTSDDLKLETMQSRVRKIWGTLKTDSYDGNLTVYNYIFTGYAGSSRFAELNKCDSHKIDLFARILKVICQRLDSHTLKPEVLNAIKNSSKSVGNACYNEFSLFIDKMAELLDIHLGTTNISTSSDLIDIVLSDAKRISLTSAVTQYVHENFQYRYNHSSSINAPEYFIAVYPLVAPVLGLNSLPDPNNGHYCSLEEFNRHEPEFLFQEFAKFLPANMIFSFTHWFGELKSEKKEEIYNDMAKVKIEYDAFNRFLNKKAVKDSFNVHKFEFFKEMPSQNKSFKERFQSFLQSMDNSDEKTQLKEWQEGKKALSFLELRNNIASELDTSLVPELNMYNGTPETSSGAAWFGDILAPVWLEQNQIVSFEN